MRTLFEMCIRDRVRTEKGYKPDSGVVSQIKIIKRLFDTSDQIIVATDAGREGELIFRYLYHYTGCTTPFAVSYTHLDVYKRQPVRRGIIMAEEPK